MDQFTSSPQIIEDLSDTSPPPDATRLELELIAKTAGLENLPREGRRFQWWDGTKRRELLVIDLTNLAAQR